MMTYYMHGLRLCSADAPICCNLQDGKGSQGPSTPVKPDPTASPAKAPVPPGVAAARAGVASPGMNAAAAPFSSPSTSRAGGGNDAAFRGCAPAPQCCFRSRTA